MGAGMLDAGAATLATVTAEPATISFGILQSSTLSIQKTVTVTNISSGTVTLTQAAGESVEVAVDQPRWKVIVPGSYRGMGREYQTSRCQILCFFER